MTTASSNVNEYSIRGVVSNVYSVHTLCHITVCVGTFSNIRWIDAVCMCMCDVVRHRIVSIRRTSMYALVNDSVLLLLFHECIRFTHAHCSIVGILCS